MIKVTNAFSRIPLFLRMVFGETRYEMAIGTGFVYEHENFYYLITNGHCVTGINPETNVRISDHAGFPSLIQARLKIKVDSSRLSEEAKVTDSSFVMTHPNRVNLPLYEDEEYIQPNWYVHPEFGYKVDVVAIPMISKDKLPNHIVLYPVNKFTELDNNHQIEVPDDVYILGYPFGITDPSEFPIWKRGSIATEPFIPYEGLPRMLVDTATREGMSGSPVIMMRSGIHNMYEGVESSETTFGTIFGFVGIYSGRIGKQTKSDVQLGIVWHKQVIEEILSAKIQGTNGFQNI